MASANLSVGPYTLLAGADLSAKQFYFVKPNAGTQDSVVLAAAGDPAIGVLQNKPTSGQGATVASFGISKVVAGGTIAAWDPIAADAAGKAVKAVGSAVVLGYATEAATAAQLVGVMLLARPAMGAPGNVLTIPVQLAAVTSATTVWQGPAAGMGFAGAILSAFFVVTTPATTAAKLATLTPAVAGTPTTGGAVALTSANCTPLGAEVDGSAITAGGRFSATQRLSVASTAVTAFLEGQGALHLVIGP